MAGSKIQADSAGATNVVRLPTAAPRKVKQRRNKATREARSHLPKFPDDRTIFARWPWMRDALDKARLIAQVKPTPELVIISAMFRALPELERLKVQAVVAQMGLNAPEAALPAVEWLHFTGGMITYGERQNIHAALEMLASGECQ